MIVAFFFTKLSSAKMCGQNLALCLHIRQILPAHFYRAKPVSDMERSGMELALRVGEAFLHCG